jgi:hypothetical protein
MASSLQENDHRNHNQNNNNNNHHIVVAPCVDCSTCAMVVVGLQFTAILLSFGLGIFWILVGIGQPLDQKDDPDTAALTIRKMLGWMMGIPWIAQACSSLLLLLRLPESLCFRASCVSLSMVALVHVILGLGLLQQNQAKDETFIHDYIRILLPWSMSIFITSIASLILQFWPSNNTNTVPVESSWRSNDNRHRHCSTRIPSMGLNPAGQENMDGIIRMEEASSSLLEPLLSSNEKQIPGVDFEHYDPDVEQPGKIVQRSHNHHPKLPATGNDHLVVDNPSLQPPTPQEQPPVPEFEQEPLSIDASPPTTFVDYTMMTTTTSNTRSRWNGTRRLLQLAAPVRIVKVLTCALEIIY